MWSVTWAVKVSKRCHLRCRYCYEWNELNSPERLTLVQWAALLRAVAAVHGMHAARTGQPGRSYLVWHGGEPLLLPTSYARAVLELEREVLGEEGLRAGDYVNVLQTGLYSLSKAWVELLVAARFQAGVSFDLVSGARVTATGRITEDRVSANLARLAAAGVPLVGAVVLASHTEHRLTEIHDAYAARRMRFQVNLLAPSPALYPGHPLELGPARAAAALEHLFVHWMNRGCPVEVGPLSEYLASVMQRRLGLEPDATPAAAWSGRLVVQPNGDVQRVAPGSTRGRGLGNLFAGDLDELLRRDAGSIADPEPDPHHSWIAERVMLFIEGRLKGWGFDPIRALERAGPDARLVGLA